MSPVTRLQRSQEVWVTTIRLSSARMGACLLAAAEAATALGTGGRRLCEAAAATAAASAMRRPLLSCGGHRPGRRRPPPQPEAAAQLLYHRFLSFLSHIGSVSAKMVQSASGRGTRDRSHTLSGWFIIANSHLLRLSSPHLLSPSTQTASTFGCKKGTSRSLRRCCDCSS